MPCLLKHGTRYLVFTKFLRNSSDHTLTGLITLPESVNKCFDTIRAARTVSDPNIFIINTNLLIMILLLIQLTTEINKGDLYANFIIVQRNNNLDRFCCSMDANYDKLRQIMTNY